MEYLVLRKTICVALVFLQGCTSFQSVEHHKSENVDAANQIKSMCSDAAFDLTDFNVGDTIRYTKCDGSVSEMRITQIDSTQLMGNSETVEVQNIKDAKLRKFSFGRSAALGGGGVATTVATILLCGAVIAGVGGLLAQTIFTLFGA